MTPADPAAPGRGTTSIETVARILRAGGVVAYPTEGVFGLGCRPDQPAAVERILALKGRPDSKGLILISDHLERLTPWLAPLDAEARARVEASWPGPVTWLWPAAPDCPTLLRGEHDTLAVRVTAHPPARELCAAADSALVSTSANPAGEAPCVDAACVTRRFGDGVDAILQAACGDLPGPTAIRDARSGAWLRGAPPAARTRPGND